MASQTYIEKLGSRWCEGELRTERRVDDGEQTDPALGLQRTDTRGGDATGLAEAHVLRDVLVHHRRNVGFPSEAALPESLLTND